MHHIFQVIYSSPYVHSGKKHHDFMANGKDCNIVEGSSDTDSGIMTVGLSIQVGPWETLGGTPDWEVGVTPLLVFWKKDLRETVYLAITGI